MKPHPIRDLGEPDVGPDSLECPECDQPMEFTGGGHFGDETKCMNPFCDNSELDPEHEYGVLEGKLEKLNREHVKMKVAMRRLLSRIEKEQIYGSDTFNAAIADARIVSKLDGT